MFLQQFTKAANSAARSRRRNRRAGFTPSGCKVWTDEEDAICRKHGNDYGTLCTLLPHRSESAIRSHCLILGLRPKRPPVTAAQVSRLRRLYPHATHAELLAAFPGKTIDQIRCTAANFGIRRAKRSFAKSGFALVDEIKERGQKLGYKICELDALVGSGRYFASARWRGRPRPNYKWICKAILALEGELTVKWSEI